MRAAVLGAFGLPALAAGALLVPRLVLAGPGDGGWLGPALVVAGLVLCALALRAGFAGRRRRVQVLAVALVLAAGQWVLLPAVGAGLATSAPHRSPQRSGLPGARSVSFPAADGVRLAGWYVPGRSGAAVIVAHGSHGSRADALAHARMLARAGYGVLAYDARGHGSSAGRPNALGWRGREDVAGAFGFLRGRPEVDPARISMLGLSMGAEEALRAAADGVGLRSVVADGAGASTLGDRALLSGGPVATSSEWVSMRLTALFGGDPEPPALKDIADRIRVPVLLIASGRRGELTVDRAFAARISAAATLWSVPDAGHTEALQRHPDAYADRVLAFLASARPPS